MTPRRLIVVLCAGGALALSALTAGPALAADNAVIKDCQSNAKLTRTYSLGALRHALKVLPATDKQYTDCFDVIQQAILAGRKPGSGSGTGSSSSGGSFLPTPVIIVLVVLILAAVTFGALAIRRRRDGPAGGAAGSSDVAKTRVMPSPSGRVDDSDDTARTRVMPSPDGDPPTRPPDSVDD